MIAKKHNQVIIHTIEVKLHLDNSEVFTAPKLLHAVDMLNWLIGDFLLYLKY